MVSEKFNWGWLKSYVPAENMMSFYFLFLLENAEEKSFKKEGDKREYKSKLLQDYNQNTWKFYPSTSPSPYPLFNTHIIYIFSCYAVRDFDNFLNHHTGSSKMVGRWIQPFFFKKKVKEKWKRKSSSKTTIVDHQWQSMLLQTSKQNLHYFSKIVFIGN